MKIHIKKDDTVEVLSGASKGLKGRVVSVDRDKYRAIVEGVNMVSKHTKPSAANPQGGIVKKEAAVHISNLMVVDPKSGKRSRIGFRKNAEGKSVRYFKKSGEEA
jgi:large subunit ribosomal protein L24